MLRLLLFQLTKYSRSTVAATGTAPTGIADAGAFHLDHVRPEKSEALGAAGTRFILRHVEDAHAVQRCHGALSGLNVLRV